MNREDVAIDVTIQDKHPEQAGGDERTAFELFVRKHCGMPAHIAVNWDAKFTNDAWEGWKARAALAQPSPAQAEKAEVVARVVHSNPVVLGQCGPLNANDELMTVAQHAASVARWAEMFNRVEQQRDAALAEVERLRQFERICEGLPQDAIDGGWTVQGIRGYAKRLEDQLKAALAEVAGLRSLLNSLLCYVERDIDRMRSDRDKSDNKEIYDRSISLAMERLKAAQNAVFTTEPGCDTAVELAAQTTQAQHSVPEASEQEKEQGWTLDYRFVERVTDLAASRTEYTTSMEATEQVLLAARELLAAAPGKEVPQAWLDVQAERRRQITAEGWTPEHDDLYCAAELPRAAAAYILNGANDEAPAIWPFSAKWWKPRDARSNYVRAGALILAEIERLDRAVPGKEGNDD
ncbi:TPA: hypothetical protein ACGJ06_002258 [Pseudomonas aeruginosa]|uniref:hypothetical protein n=1 Tax=Pseudomonas aeruginosa TaxID=287 RepID=UPI000AC42510|nr:hypothetical protein [Pseudomonas aeruginosa]